MASRGKRAPSMTSVNNIVPLYRGNPTGLSLFEQALQAASCPILIIQSTAGRQKVVHANTAFQYLTGYAALDILGRDCAHLFFQKPGESDPEELRRVIQQGRAIHVTLPVRRRDRSSIWTEVQV